MHAESTIREGDAAGPVIPTGRFWAKLDPRESPTSYHPLVAHSSDVAAVLRRLLQPDSALAARLARSAGLGALPDGAIAQLVYVAALHDLGKVNHSFQDQWRPRAVRSKGHVRVVLESMGYGPLRLALQEVVAPLGLPPEDASELLRTAICHHGKPWKPPLSPTIPIWQPRSDRDPLAEIRRLVNLARTWSSLDGVTAEETIPLTPHFLHLFAGALTLADWIGSTRRAFPFDPSAEEDPLGYWATAVERADRACAAIGLTPTTEVVALDGLPLLERVFPRIFGALRPEHLAGVQPTPLQIQIATMELPNSGSRVLIESETGSGKTEAALALYARLRSAGRVGGIIFALPTRATATAMLRRVEAAAEAMYEPGDRPTIALAMGGDQSHAEVTGGDGSHRDLVAAQPDTYPDADKDDLVRWSSDNAKKFFAAEIVVGTLDQLLLGGLAVKHAHLRLAALSRHLMVVDELHSYDRYMSEVLERLLELHSASGGVALLMSATLSDRERLRFGGLLEGDFDEQTPLDEAVARPYPVISVCPQPGNRWSDVTLHPANGPPKPPLQWRLCDEQFGLEQAVEAARSGARVCILRSTVKGARGTIAAVVDALGGGGANSLLWRPQGSVHTPAYHSRYTLPDRLALDAGVLSAFGRGCIAGDGRILVATQVAEQSLDVDFDVMVTDLCPIDVLLQRLGRVWRHRGRDASRPDASRQMQAWVIEPVGGLEPLLPRLHGGDHGWGTVYRHLGFLELTRREIRDRITVEVPRDNRALIEAVYHQSPLAALRESSDAWERHFQAQEGVSLTHELAACNVVVRFDDTYLENADRFNRDIAGPVRTRLGDDRVRVTLPGRLAGLYDPSGYTDFVDLPFERLQRAGVNLAEPVATSGPRVDDRTHYSLQQLAFSYGPQGWEW